MSPRIVAVFGATGSQGSSVINALLADGTFTPRAVTRNPDSEASKALQARGVEVVQGDLANKVSLVKALQGSEAVFGVTNYYDPAILHANPKGEIDQGKNLVDAAKDAGVKFFVWSCFPPNATKISNGRYTGILHLDNKAIVEEYLQASGLANATVYAGWFAENLWNFGSLQKTSTGYTIPIPNFKPTAHQAVTWVGHDLGPAVLALLNNYNKPGKEISGKGYPVITAQITYPDMVELISKALGVEVTFTSPPTSGMAELDEMFEYQSEIGFYRDIPVPNPALVALGAEFGTFSEFVETEIKKRFA